MEISDAPRVSHVSLILLASAGVMLDSTYPSSFGSNSDFRLSLCSNALDFKGTIIWNQLCPGSQVACLILHKTLNSFAIDLLDAKSLGQAKAILDDGSNYYGSITRDGSFVMCVARDLGHPPCSSAVP